MSPFFFPFAISKRKSWKKDITWARGHSILYSIRFVVARDPCAVGFNFLFVFLFQFFSLFSKPKIKKQVKTPLNSISVTPRDDDGGGVESCARAAHIHTQRERMKKKEENLYIRKAAATSECPSVQPETSGPPLEQVTTQKKTKVMCLRHPFSRLAATRCHDNNILLFRLLLLYYFAISGDLQQCVECN